MAPIAARSAKPEKFNLKHEFLLAITKIIALAVVALACSVAVFYCSHIYYDREEALREALTCSKQLIAQEGLSAWLTNGTLLGAMRLQRFVMWDGEIDVAVLNSGSQAKSLDQLIESLESQCFPYSSSVQRSGIGQPRRWRLCTRRVCAEIHEFVSTKSPSGVVPSLWSVDGYVPVDQVLPLDSSCVVEGVTFPCPANSTFFLDAAYGADWRSGSLTSLFF